MFSKKTKIIIRRFTPLRLLNLIIAEIQYHLRSAYLYNYPTAITIEPGNICNLRCPLCPTGQKDKGAERGFLELNDFKKVVDEIGDRLMMIRLYNWGEPLLNKNFKAMVDYAVSRGIEVKISTNLSMPLSEQDAENVIDCYLKKIYISINGAGEESYSKYHIGGDFNRAMSNMKMLLEKKRQLNNRYTEIIWLFHVFSHNEHEIETAKKMAGEIGIKLNINSMRTDMGKEIFETPEDAIKRDGKWLPESKEFNIFDMEKGKVKKDFRCNLLWKETVINWDGSVLPCCSVFSEKFSFGNIRNTPFRDIWNNKMHIASRKEVASPIQPGKSGARNDEDFRGKPVCFICKSKGYPFNQ